MFSFFVKNLDSFIVSTIFLILGFLPTIFDSHNAKNKDISFENTNINNSDIGNTYSQNTYNQNYTENNQNTNTVVINNNNSTTTTDDPWSVFVLGIIFIIPLILFYKHIGKILVYSITITISCLLLSLLMYRNLLKTGSYISISNNIISISIRNIICWLLMLVNYITIFYKVNFSSLMKPFINLIKTLSLPIDSETTSKIFSFLSNNPYESFTAIFIVLSFLLSIFLIPKLFLSYIWIISSIKVFIKPNNKFWAKIYSILNRRESNLDKKYWIYLFVILFSLSTGIIAYILSLSTRMS